MNRRGSLRGGGRSPMDRAADGLEASGKALSAMYEALRQALPLATEGALRGVSALERLADAAERLAAASEAHGNQNTVYSRILC